ncbi:MAG: hypothetical protein E6G34_09950 [Actinobacteria bacterium]|nr:MAG: hypothetical protein E6G34_09950 [Actinomycetota bacterium]
MRSIKLTSALAAVAMSVAVAPSGALAIKHHRHAHALSARHCRVGFNAAPRFVEAGETALTFGVLLCPAGTNVSGQAVTIFQHTAGTGGASAAGTTSTDTTGRFQLPTAPLFTNSTFYATAAGAKSPKRAVKVSPKVTFTGPPDGSTLFTRGGPFTHVPHNALSNRVIFAGTVSPADVGAQVFLQRENAVGPEEWHRIGRGLVGPGGIYSIPHTFVFPGEANIRVIVRATKRHARGASEPLSYQILQAQNPVLTIESSADPIFYGQSATIHGTIATGPGATLTLLARGRRQHGFLPIATTTSTTGGAYTFAAQTPLANTIYRVTGGGKASAVLFEGVKYLVTASASTSTVQAGQPFTISGTVSPAVAGHPVYLQQQNAGGIGYHPVQIGVVSAGGTYSITHVPFNAGMRKYRIKVPGDPANQGAATAAIAILVTPATTSLLKPEAPGNSSLPSEGHV